eukprot:TRINITY_DN607_c0_g3_i1.p3 TRINITY_DN607_c0_g3~~TRINITY_DN607_c0_g3_i1.p3  ORF type:complete len:191 (+),score=15.63 TRINITY_DN607_c0_g3_i1:79-573(+)
MGKEFQGQRHCQPDLLQTIGQDDSYIGQEEEQGLEQPLLVCSTLDSQPSSGKTKRKCSFPIFWTFFAAGSLVFLTCWIFALPIFLVAVLMGTCLLRTPQQRKRELAGWIANAVMLFAYIVCACVFGYYAAHLVKDGETVPSDDEECSIGCYQNFWWLNPQKGGE